jgi:hypothetical protein
MVYTCKSEVPGYYRYAFLHYSIALFSNGNVALRNGIRMTINKCRL